MTEMRIRPPTFRGTHADRRHNNRPHPGAQTELPGLSHLAPSGQNTSVETEQGKRACG
ncbi:uncharacterized protein B0I36DRAFT_336912 [Microdochium trichocladiopsis]|uniref:Uncharacterized protein n=1 Tax=Microdochium trichocladiopsis TaxID=1682393 RepID=A0A9P8XUH5_9PEZI|nr:uncharacterized protein B0I36DRAFT_336912 [Microdochium trichocladiopsis]KAH7016154.1 hypothetical protein B0I36DRAFT_336912 [Microdochium trichocladiopsis]